MSGSSSIIASSLVKRAYDHFDPSNTDGPSEHLILEPDFPYGEDLLQFIWEQRLYEPNDLRTTDGRSVEVLEPGRIQRNSGPDLIDANVRIDGQLWAGTVEVHLRSSEWYAHGHQFDPAYESVVLHVVYQHDREVCMQRGGDLSTVELMTRIPAERIRMHLQLMRGKGFVPCAARIDAVDGKALDGWLNALLLQRLERKQAIVSAMHEQLAGDVEGTFYHMLARGFGMQVNAEPFGMLALALPLRTLQRYRDDPMRTEALLFGQAGMLQEDQVDDYPRALQAEHFLLAELHELRPAPVAAWKFGRMRPANLPTVRIAQFAQLMMKCDGSFSALFRSKDVEHLRSVLDVQASDYWTTHHVFDRPSDPMVKRLGRSAADHIILNSIIPTLYALGRIQGRSGLTQQALGLLEQLPVERNAILKGWSRTGLEAATAGQGQALLELHKHYCRQRRCLSCVIGAELLRGTR